MSLAGDDSQEWRWWPGYASYEVVMGEMAQYVEGMRDPKPLPEAIWGVEHASVYTAGTSANPSDVKNPQFPIVQTNRGGKYTYHGPGQLVVYPLLDLRRRQLDPRSYVRKLEQWMQSILAECGVKAEPHTERIGLWVGEEKIGAIGVRVSKGIAWHGFSLNVDINLEHFSGIVPCGLSYGVTSLRKQGWLGSVGDVWLIAQDKYTYFF